MIFNRGFSAPRHDNDVLNARMQRFFDAVLNDRLVDERKHFLGLRLRGRKKSGPKTRGWKDCFANFRCRHRSYLAHPGSISATPESAVEYFPALRDADSRPGIGHVLRWFFPDNMAYVIAEPCIGTKDTACVDACPVDCIHPKKDEANFADAEMLYIDPVECIDCGACVPVCPVSAIFAQDDLPEKWNEFTEKNAKFFGR
jgi:ferredoxin